MGVGLDDKISGEQIGNTASHDGCGNAEFPGLQRCGQRDLAAGCSHGGRAETFGQIRSVHPDRVTMHTWTDPDNAAMYATNRAFGYRAVERMHEVQVKD